MNDAFSTRATWSLVLLTMINAVNFLDRGILNILLEPIKADLALTDVMLGLITGFGFTLVYSIAGVPIARLADRISRTRVLALGIILWSVMTSASALARSGTQLVMARVGVGIGEAGGFAPSQTLLSELFPVGRRAAALAIWSVGSPLGTFVGLAAGGYLSVHFGWRTALFSAGVPGLLLSILAFFTLKDNRHQAADTAGSPMFPTIDSGLRSLLRRPSILFTLAGSAFFAVTFSALASWGPTFFHRVHHLDLQAIGLQLGTAYASAGIVGALSGGWIIARYSRGAPSWSAAIPGIACLLACPCLLLLAFAPGIAAALIGALTSLVCLNACVGPILSVYQIVAPRPVRTQIAALHTLVAGVGLGFGPLLVGIVNDAFQGTLGAISIRWSLFSSSLWLIPAGACLLLASRKIVSDSKTAGLPGVDVSETGEFPAV
jgi:predicted MFS family arabinose efflux permease